MKNKHSIFKFDLSSFNFQFSISRGMTLLELLVAVGVMLILAGGILTVLDPMEQIKKAQDAKKKSDFNQISKALEQYYSDYGKYPNFETGTYKLKPIISGTETVVSWGSAWRPYMDALPIQSGASYVYYSPAGNQSYYLYTHLARGIRDSQVCSGGGNCPSVATNSIPVGICPASGLTCNYAITSPNVSP